MTEFSQPINTVRSTWASREGRDFALLKRQ
jgi:hypothetical protein